MSRPCRRSCALLLALLCARSACDGADEAGAEAATVEISVAKAAVAALAEVLVWRTAEGTDDYPLAGEIRLRGDERLDGNGFEGATGIGITPAGHRVRIALVRNDNLAEFVSRQSLVNLRPLERTPLSCRHGRFLLNDPRVGLFHNQRISYEVAVSIAAVLRRTLVMPGFFKFPHPDAYEGTQWVPVRQLFDLGVLKKCYHDVVQLDELLKQCGPEVLDNHVTVPFQTTWMRSSIKAPWINETRPELRWAPFDGGERVRLRPKETRPEKPLQLDEPFWYLLHGFLEAGVAAAQTVRVHGLIAADTDVRGTTAERPVCFFPGKLAVQSAGMLLQRVRDSVHKGGEAKTLGLHLRIFKRSTSTSGGYMRPEVAGEQERLCNFEPEVFIPFVAYAFTWKFPGWWPTHTYLASNEADLGTLMVYLQGFPGARLNPYTPRQFNQAVTADDSADALNSVLIDALMCAYADRFIGNACSTMSQYIGQLRTYFKLPQNTSMFLGGSRHAHVVEQYRSMLEKKQVYFMRADHPI